MSEIAELTRLIEALYIAIVIQAICILLLAFLGGRRKS